MMDPIIISVAPNGARKTTQDHPALPVTPEAIAAQAEACCAAGAALIHLHVRDGNQRHTLDVGIYRETIAAIRARVGDRLIVQATSEAVGLYTPEEQMAMVCTLRPEAVSLAIREIIPDPSHEGRAREFLAQLFAARILPQYILYSPAEVLYFTQLRKRGVVPGKHAFVLFVLGKKTGSPEKALKPSDVWAKPEDIDLFLETFDQGVTLAETHWGVCAFGGWEQACMEKVVACGGHVRIGFENNHLMTDGSIAPDNAALIQQFRDKMTAGPRPIADAAATRHLLRRTLEP